MRASIILMFAGIVAFITPRLNVSLPEGVSIPTLPSDIVGAILVLSGIAKGLYDELTDD
jgi:hypothetical protein